MAEIHARNVVGNGAGLLGTGENLIRRDVEKFRMRIDKSPDQPRAGNTIYFRSLSSNPLFRDPHFLSGRKTSTAPLPKTPGELCGLHACRTKVASCRLADLAT